MTIEKLIEILKNQDQQKPVEFLIVGKDTSVVAMNLTNATCEPDKVLEAFHSAG